ncbi:hypothetical protein ACWERV_00785 [Streptomyces sp. NPDC004031]
MHVDFEERLSTMLRRTADTFAPDDPLLLVATGHARGRRMRRRRTAGVAAGAVALVVLAAGGVAAGTALSRDGSGVAATPSGASPTVTEPDFATVNTMTQRLVRLLPPTARTTGSGGREPGDGVGPDVTVGLDMDNGTLEVELAIGKEPREAFACTPGTPSDRCRIRNVNGGRLLLTKDDASVIGHRAPGQGWVLALYKKGDHIVALGQYHVTASGFPDTETPFGAPMLDEAQITRIVTDQAWSQVADTLPSPSRLSYNTPPGGAAARGSAPR